MNFFHHKDLGNHLLQLCPKVVKHPVYHLSLCTVVALQGYHSLQLVVQLYASQSV